MLLFKRGEGTPKAHAKVTGGHYVFDRVPVEWTYFIRPSWEGKPTQVNIHNCRAGKTLQVRKINITGRPMYD